MDSHYIALPETGSSIGPFPLEASVGYQLRLTHRFFAQELQDLLQPHGVPAGMWYFLRVLWEQDGLSQREVSQLVGATAPTTVEQLRKMEQRGLIRRVQAPTDKRKIQVFLTSDGRALERKLLPLAEQVVEAATRGFSAEDLDALRSIFARMQANLQRSARRRSGRPPRNADL